MLNEEQDLVKTLTATLSSFKEDPSMAVRLRGRGEEPSAHHPGHDPLVWPPPTPVEARLVAMERILFILPRAAGWVQHTCSLRMMNNIMRH